MGRGALSIGVWRSRHQPRPALLTAVAAAPAHAGTIWVAEGNMSAGQSGGCNAFGLGGDLSVVSVPSSCPMSLQVNGDMPQWQVASWSTTAPPGITIDSAWTANGDVSSGGYGRRVCRGGLLVHRRSVAWIDACAPGQQWFNTGQEGSSNINSQIYGFQIACTENLLSGGCYPPWPTLPVLSVSGIELEGTENSAPYRHRAGRAVDKRIVCVESAGRFVAGVACTPATSPESATRSRRTPECAAKRSLRTARHHRLAAMP